MRTATTYRAFRTAARQEIIDITDDVGALDLGPWQRVFYGEWDGQRPKRVLFKATGS